MESIRTRPRGAQTTFLHESCLRKSPSLVERPRWREKNNRQRKERGWPDVGGSPHNSAKPIATADRFYSARHGLQLHHEKLFSWIPVPRFRLPALLPQASPSPLR